MGKQGAIRNGEYYTTADYYIGVCFEPFLDRGNLLAVAIA